MNKTNICLDIYIELYQNGELSGYALVLFLLSAMSCPIHFNFPAPPPWLKGVLQCYIEFKENRLFLLSFGILFHTKPFYKKNIVHRIKRLTMAVLYFLVMISQYGCCVTWQSLSAKLHLLSPLHTSFSWCYFYCVI